MYQNIVVSLLVIAGLSLCQSQVASSKNPVVYPAPESAQVNPNGSFPLGFKKNLEKAKINHQQINFNSQNRYTTDLKPDAKLSGKLLNKKLAPYLKDLNEAQQKQLSRLLYEHMKWWIIRSILVGANNNNFGALVLKGKYWKDESGIQRPLVVFRASFTPHPREKNSFYRTLLEKGLVKHVVNLYDGEMYMDDLVEQEAMVARANNATYTNIADFNYRQWRHAVAIDPQAPQVRQQAMQTVARIIKEKILQPGGKPPKGNVFIHCGGGMHRTGMIMGILQKCINNDSMDYITDVYKYHVSYKGEKFPGGYEQSNIDFIRDFPKKLLVTE